MRSLKGHHGTHKRCFVQKTRFSTPFVSETTSTGQEPWCSKLRKWMGTACRKKQCSLEKTSKLNLSSRSFFLGHFANVCFSLTLSVRFLTERVYAHRPKYWEKPLRLHVTHCHRHVQLRVALTCFPHIEEANRVCCLFCKRKSHPRGVPSARNFRAEYSPSTQCPSWRLQNAH